MNVASFFHAWFPMNYSPQQQQLCIAQQKHSYSQESPSPAGQGKISQTPPKYGVRAHPAHCKPSFTELHPCPPPLPSLFSKHKPFTCQDLAKIWPQGQKQPQNSTRALFFFHPAKSRLLQQSLIKWLRASVSCRRKMEQQNFGYSKAVAKTCVKSFIGCTYTHFNWSYKTLKCLLI